MPTILIPPQMRDLTDGEASVRVSGRTVAEALANVETIHPGFQGRLYREDDLHNSIVMVVDGQQSLIGIYQPLQEESVVSFIPMFDGG